MKKNIINNFIYSFKSSPMAFILILIGTIGQSMHTYDLTLRINALEYPLDIISSVILAFFFSAGLLFFSVKLGLAKDKEGDSKQTVFRKLKDRKKYTIAANTFQAFETYINLFYWVTKLVYIEETHSFVWDNWYYLTVAVPFSIFLPAFLRYYAGEITDEVSRREVETLYSEVEDLKETVNKLNEFITDLGETISKFKLNLSGTKEYKMTIHREDEQQSFDKVELTLIKKE